MEHVKIDFTLRLRRMFVSVLLFIAECTLKFACISAVHLLVLYMTLAFAVGLFFVLEHLGYDMSRALRESVLRESEYLKPSEWACAAYRCLRNDPDCEDRVDGEQKKKYIFVKYREI